ncbi:MAG: alkane 1-monooxygenase [Actinomycetota bacterium]|nr:alkane 1-monooxygenase [Actinomycetota bacterium]
MAVTAGTAQEQPNTELPGTAWRDPKRYLWPLGLLVPLLPLIGWGLTSATGLGLFWWFGPLFLYGVLPILDTIIGTDALNPADGVVAKLEADRYYRWCIYLFIPLQFATLVWAAWKVTQGGMPWYDNLGLTITTGIVGGVAINTAHELGHKRLNYERWLSKVALAQSAYGHFFIEHNRGHHGRVATPEDPASSRFGESFFAFWPRTVGGSMTSAWSLERKRLDRSDHRLISLHNDIISAWAMTAVLYIALIVAFGWKTIPFLAIQAVFGFSLLEVVNYLEHYGLRRQMGPDGRYERCQPRHSWNSNNVASNLILYHLQRHSDHHAHPTRRFQALRHFDEAPQLPSGYGTMILLAYFPPLWRKVMDHRVVEHYGGDMTKAGVQPSKRAKVLARYSPSAPAAPGDQP